MLLYIFVALFPLIVGAAFNQSRVAELSMDEGQTERFYKRRWWWLFMAALPMFALIAFRGAAMGPDTGGYLKFFSQMVNTPWDRLFIVNERTYEFEEGFVLFEKIVTIFTKNPKVYQVIYSAIYIVSVVTFANRLEKLNFSFLYFFATIGLYTFMFTGVRQCLAMCICLWAYPYIKQRKLLPFLLILALAFFFHRSSMFFLPAYFIFDRKVNVTNSIIYIVGMLAVFLTRNYWSDWLMDNFEYNADQNANGSGFIFFMVMCLITAFSILTLVLPKKLDSERLGHFNLNILCWLFWLLRIFTLSAERPSMFFMFFSVSNLCYAIDAPQNSRDKLIYKVVAYSAFAILYIYRFLTSQVLLIPYESFFKI